MSHYPERAYTVDFKDAATLRFGHSDVIFDLFTETRFCTQSPSYPNFQNFYSFTSITEPK